MKTESKLVSRGRRARHAPVYQLGYGIDTQSEPSFGKFPVIHLPHENGCVGQGNM